VFTILALFVHYAYFLFHKLYQKMKPFYFLFAFFCFKNTNFAQTTLYSERFDAGMPKNIKIFGSAAALRHPSVAYINEGWKVVGGTRFAAEMDSFAVSTSYNEPSGEQIADGRGAANEWLVLPAIALGSNAVFSWNARSFDPTYPDGYEVLVGAITSNDEMQTADIVYTQKAENEKWTARSVSLAKFEGKTVNIAIRNTTKLGYLLGIDDLKVVSGKPTQSEKSSVFTQIQTTPNPTTGVLKLYLQCKQPESIRIEILNTQGQTVKEIGESKVLDDVLSIDLGGNQPNGLYFIKISTATESQTALVFLNK
jgi:Secretion system C-terminal sorting domain